MLYEYNLHVYMPHFNSTYHNDSAQCACLYATYNSHALSTINICLTSLTRAKPKDKMEFPA